MITNIAIKGQEHPVRYGFGALMLVEELLGKPWGEIQNSRANFALWYCCFLNADEDFPYLFDELIDCCDEDLTLVSKMRDAYTSQLERWGKPKEPTEDDDKKKD